MKRVQTEVPPSEFSNAFVGYILDAHPQFAELMAARMAMSFSKYGAVRDAYPHKVNALDSARKRLDLYRYGGQVKGGTVTAGNTEYLVDRANFLMIEEMAPTCETYLDVRAIIHTGPHLHVASCYIGLYEKGFGRFRPGNTEFLRRAALATAEEWAAPTVVGARFESTDSAGSPGRVRNDDENAHSGNLAAHESGSVSKTIPRTAVEEELDKAPAFYRGRKGD